jgi:hypothetical protein
VWCPCAKRTLRDAAEPPQAQSVRPHRWTKAHDTSRRTVARPQATPLDGPAADRTDAAAAVHLRPVVLGPDAGKGGRCDGGTLITSFPRRPRGVRRKPTPAEVAAIERVQDQLASQPPSGDVWIDPTTLTVTPAEVTQGWLKRKIADCATFVLTF